MTNVTNDPVTFVMSDEEKNLADDMNNTTPETPGDLPEDLRRLLDRAQASDEGEDVYDPDEESEDAEDEDPE